jgi:hypothetical protein
MLLLTTDTDRRATLLGITSPSSPAPGKDWVEGQAISNPELRRAPLLQKLPSEVRRVIRRLDLSRVRRLIDRSK